jgi:hypothetical protein
MTAACLPATATRRCECACAKGGRSRRCEQQCRSRIGEQYLRQQHGRGRERPCLHAHCVTIGATPQHQGGAIRVAGLCSIVGNDFVDNSDVSWMMAHPLSSSSQATMGSPHAGSAAPGPPGRRRARGLGREGNLDELLRRGLLRLGHWAGAAVPRLQHHCRESRRSYGRMAVMPWHSGLSVALQPLLVCGLCRGLGAGTGCLLLQHPVAGALCRSDHIPRPDGAAQSSPHSPPFLDPVACSNRGAHDRSVSGADSAVLPAVRRADVSPLGSDADPHAGLCRRHGTLGRQQLRRLRAWNLSQQQ